MKLERGKNAVRNIRIGLLNKIITILLPFILRTVIIKILGTEYLGLSSLFKSVLQVLSLSELGIGSAMIFNMYKPIADGNEEEQAALLLLYRRVYRVIGGIIFIGGLAVLPFLKFLIHGEIPTDVNIYLLYIIYILNSSESYFISSYQSTVLSSYQRRDIIQKIGLTVNSFLYVVQIICLLFFRNYYMYVIWLPIFTMTENFVTAYYVRRHYSNLFNKPVKIKTEDTKKLFVQVRDLFGHKLSNVVTNSVDTIVISTFLDLSTVTIYNNYYYLISAVNGILDIVYQSILAGIGNSLELESNEKNRSDFFGFFFSNAWIVGWSAICFLCLYQPMMKAWMGEGLLMDNSSVILLALYFYVWKMRQPITTYKDASGMWKEDRLRPYVEIIVNLTVNIILVQLIGVNGIIISTIVSMVFVSFPWEARVYTQKSCMIYFDEYMKKCLMVTILTGIIALVTWGVCSQVKFTPIKTVIVRLVICIIFPNAIYGLVYMRNKYVKNVLDMMKRRMLNR